MKTASLKYIDIGEDNTDLMPTRGSVYCDYCNLSAVPAMMEQKPASHH